MTPNTQSGSEREPRSNIVPAPALCPGSFVAVPGTDYALFDGDVHRLRHEGELPVPSYLVRATRPPGEFVQLVFREHGCNPERMWVEVVKNFGNGDYIGELANDPLLMVSLKCGDAVAFNARNVIKRLLNGLPCDF